MITGLIITLPICITVLIIFFVLNKSRCRHKWEIIDNGRITQGGVKIGDYYYLRCEKCGKMKTENLG